MTKTRLRLVVLKGTILPDSVHASKSVPSAFDLVEVENAEEARRVLADAAPGSVMLAPEVAALLDGGEDDRGPAGPFASALETLGDGVGVVDSSGTLRWCNEPLAELDAETRRLFVEHCRGAIDALERGPGAGTGPDTDTGTGAGRKLAFSSAGSDWELVVSPTSAPTPQGPVTAVVGLLWNVTSTRHLQRKIDAIDSAGSELMRIEGAAISKLNMAERLRLLEEKIVHYVHDLLQFDNFEIRLLDRQSNRLELVVAVGLSPLKIGEVIHAEAEGNGISGLVATTGESYICADVRHDPHYREGLDNAASSLTVPLRLHDEVIGVFNVESNTRGAFHDDDRQFTEIFGRYVAMAMHILDLLVVERYTTNEQVSANVLGELSDPIDAITRRAAALREAVIEDPAVKSELEAIADMAADLRRRMEACARGPRTILGAEQERHRYETDPLLAGRRILVADDEPEIRETLERILSQKGCDVTVCGSGMETLEALEESAQSRRHYELVISDIKMHDRNGYEIFRAAKAITPDIHVILMTGFGYDPHHSIIRASQEGLHSLMFKPFKASQLLERITKALAPDA